MKVYVWKDEAYPIYGIDTHVRDALVEIPDALYRKYKKQIRTDEKEERLEETMDEQRLDKLDEVCNNNIKEE